MMRPLRLLLICLLVPVIASLSGCRHKVQTLPVPPAQAPPLNDSTITVITPLPTVPATAKPSVEPATAPKPSPPPPAVKEKKPRHHRRRSESKETHPTVETANQANPVPPAAVAPTAPAVQWSTGTALDPKQRTQMVNAIDAQEKRMGSLGAAAKGQTAILLQIKLFLQKARDSVASNDLDGATTLTTKARVLLDELQGVTP